MAPTPSSLRGAAEAIRRTARRLELDFEPLVHQGGPETWEGPAASSFDAAARLTVAAVAAVLHHLRSLARRLDARADDMQAWIEAEERRVAELRATELHRLQAARWSEVDGFGSGVRVGRE